MGSHTSIGKLSVSATTRSKISANHTVIVTTAQSIEEKNPDVVPLQADSDDEYMSEENCFERLQCNTAFDAQPHHQILYTPHMMNCSTPPLRSPSSSNGAAAKQAAAAAAATFAPITTAATGGGGGVARPYGELSLTTNPAFAFYSTPQRRPPPPLYSSPKLQMGGSAAAAVVTAAPASSLSSNANIYTRIPTRPFTYESRLSPLSTASSAGYGSSGGGGGGVGGGSGCVTMPMLFQHHHHHEQQPHNATGHGIMSTTGMDDNS